MPATAAGLTPPAIVHDGREGPLTRARLRRTLLIYLALCALGVLPSLVGVTPPLQAAGLGLLFPGGGFLAVGGWAILLLPLSLLLFAIALVAWFGSGMSIAPPIVWLGSAALAAALAGETVWPPAPYLAMLAAVAFQFYMRVRARKAIAADLAKRDERNAYLPKATAAVRARAASKPPRAQRELSGEQLAALRYCLDRALQPIGQLKGFTRIDQFQTAALRYQLNVLGYILSTVQCQATPNFHGYLSEAQRRVIEQYLQRPIWSYWRLENLWGNLNPNPDPVGKDNIMLTGFFGINLGLYQSNTGDRRYEARGSLPFRWNDSTVFRHDFHDVVQSIADNMQTNPFCLYPCEPNWIYTPCNFRGLTSLFLHDRLCGTRDYERLASSFFEKLLREFTKPSGSLYALRSTLTGLPVPFPFEENARAAFDNALDADMAVQDWAITRHEFMQLRDGRLEPRIPAGSVDFGNYKPGPMGLLGMLLQGAREMGDTEAADAIKAKLDAECGRKLEDGALSYAGSNAANLCIMAAILSERDDWRDTVRHGPPQTAFSGPLLCEARYPDVLVARAFSPDGEGLDLVLYNGAAAGLQELGFARLRPGRRYRITMASVVVSEAAADGQGKLHVSLMINGRTPVTLSPAD